MFQTATFDFSLKETGAGYPPSKATDDWYGLQTRRSTSAALDISYHRLLGYWHCHWKGAQTEATLQAGVRELIGLSWEQNGNKVFFDTRQAKGNAWLLFQAFARMLPTHLIPSGLTRISWVSPANPLVHVTTKLAGRLFAPRQESLRVFSDEYAAQLWLLERR